MQSGLLHIIVSFGMLKVPSYMLPILPPTLQIARYTSPVLGVLICCIPAQHSQPSKD